MDITTFSKIIMLLTLMNRICLVNHAYISEAEYHKSTIALLSSKSSIRHLISTLLASYAYDGGVNRKKITL